MKTLAAAALACALLSACATTQYTSGADYADRTALYYDQTTDVAALGTTTASLDQEISAIAAVEPSLVFPARIGIAHISEGRLASVPAAHLAAWSPLRERIEPRLGEVVPISPLITGMVSKPAPRGQRDATIANIRRGAARQHVDYVLVYETHRPTSHRDKNALSLSDLSIIGMFVLPSREVEVEATASAIMLDVRNGYPYGTASGVATKDGVATLHGAGDKERKLEAVARTEAVRDLADDVDEMLDQLTDRLAARRVASLSGN